MNYNSEFCNASNSVICKVCGRKMHRHFEAKGFWIYRCSTCTFEQIDIAEDVARTEYKAEYFESNKYKDKVTLELENRRRLGLLERYAEKTSKVLDYGCASGEFVDFVKDAYDITGCDISDDAIAIAKEKHSTIKDKYSTLKEFKESGSRYDVIVLWDVIEHIEYPDQIIELLDGKLEKSGYLILSTPDIGSLFAKITKSMWPFMTPPEHLCFFTKRSFQKFAEKHGFEIIKRYDRGKWVNLGFVLYKFNRVSKIKIPQKIVKKFSKGWLSKLRIYVLTHDIQYVVMKKQVKRR